MLFCLSYLCPGKTGSRIRKVLTVFFGLALIYAVCWALILKELKFNPKSAVINEEGILKQEIEVQNNSYAGIELIDLDFYNEEDEKLEKTSEGLPAFIKSKSSEDIKINLKYMKFKAVELKVRILGLTKKFKQDIPEKK